MVWENEVSAIVILCGLSEHGRVAWVERGGLRGVLAGRGGDSEGSKAQPLYPDLALHGQVGPLLLGAAHTGGQRLHGPTEGSHTIPRTPPLQKSVGWPDRKVPAPEHTKNLLKLIQALALHKQKNLGPIAIHCR